MSADGPPTRIAQALEPDDDADRRMADALSGSSTGAELRRRLQAEGSAQADDLLGRLNALDFVSSVVGGATDVPERLGVYAIQGLLGRGGMGTVYLAFQDQLEREVALKVLSPTWSADPTMRQRFRAEAKATAALHHRHIVPIYDYGEAAGMLFFAMERVDGISLDKHIHAARRMQRKPLAPIDAARRFAGVADALGLAHRRRILHRDVKPGNILVAADGTLALTDFGLAKVLDQGSVRLTSKGGGFLGTLHYSSPEQAAGRDLTPASDLYSLGVTMFEAVTGELPLAGKTTEAVLQSILYGTPRRLRDLLPKPPRDLEAVLDKLLSREPQDRYQDGEVLARDLQRIADGEPVQIRRQPLWLRLWRRARKNPVLAGALAAAVVLLLLTVTLFSVLRRETRQGLLSRHQVLLTRIADMIRAEPGPPAGPDRLLECLVGGSVATASANETILRSLREAAAELPSDPMPAAMQTAYIDDPLPEATTLLAEGRGFEALRLYDRAISAVVRRADDLSIDIRLYRLCLGRAVANLTAAVMHLNQATGDLVRATLLRPGATFPATLTSVLAVVQAGDDVDAVAALERELDTRPHEQQQVAARLLLGMAAMQPTPDANLMDFGLGYTTRRRLHDLARRWLPATAETATASAGPPGLATQLLTACAKVVRPDAAGGLQRVEIAAIRRRIDETVHPDAALQGMRAMLQMLEPARGMTLVDRAGRSLPPPRQLMAWRALLQLRPPRALLDPLLPEFDALRQAHPELPDLAAIAARLHLAARGEQAPALANAWARLQPDDPEALLCRLEANLISGRMLQALDDGMAAVQRSVDPAEMLDRVIRAFEVAAAENPLLREVILPWAEQFRTVDLAVQK
ncbi:MAG: serine/threonine protein kinase [Planctomycetes bacterium]|nr:serine/threonine protein kinase [Planctomycetota bacterium]